MYPHHNTDFADVLPFDRNNCRGGSDKTCMYYNEPGKAHYNYTAVQGTGDSHSANYKCNHLTFDNYNDENLYADHAINGLGGYETVDAYGDINNAKGLYGPVDYPQSEMCPHASMNNVNVMNKTIQSVVFLCVLALLYKNRSMVMSAVQKNRLVQIALVLAVLFFLSQQ